MRQLAPVYRTTNQENYCSRLTLGNKKLFYLNNVTGAIRVLTIFTSRDWKTVKDVVSSFSLRGLRPPASLCLTRNIRAFNRKYHNESALRHHSTNVHQTGKSRRFFSNAKQEVLFTHWFILISLSVNQLLTKCLKSRRKKSLSQLTSFLIILWSLNFFSYIWTCLVNLLDKLSLLLF